MVRVVFSDLHGELQQLQRLLAAHPTAELWCAGDILGPTTRNQACVDLLRRRVAIAVQGNHEAQMWSFYAPGLETGARAWVRTRPLELTRDDARLLHTRLERQADGSIAFWHIDSPEQAVELMQTPLTWVGHSHQPSLWSWRPGEKPTWHAAHAGLFVRREAGVRYLVDVGSLADGTFVLWTRNTLRFERTDPMGHMRERAPR